MARADLYRDELPRSSWLYQAAVMAALVVGAASSIAAQQPDSLRQRARADSAQSVDSLKARQGAQRLLQRAHVVRVWEAGAVIGGVMLLTALDEPIRREMLRRRSSGLDNLATLFRQQGEPWYYISVSLGTFGLGVVTNSPDIRRAGRRLVASVAGAGIATYAIKQMVGRSRPNEDVGAFKFHPFTTLKDSLGVETRGAFPSGHTMAAFAVATSLADDIHYPLASVALYTIAAGAAWSRMYDDRHWFSDTALGAVLGFTTAKVVSGRWRVFGWKPPAFMVRPTGDVSLQWTLPLKGTHVGGD